VAQKQEREAASSRRDKEAEINQTTMFLRRELEAMREQLAPSHPAIKRTEAAIEAAERSAEVLRREAEVSILTENYRQPNASKLQTEMQQVQEQLAAADRDMAAVVQKQRQMVEKLAAAMRESQLRAASSGMGAVAPGTYWQVIAVAPDLAAVIPLMWLKRDDRLAAADDATGEDSRAQAQSLSSPSSTANDSATPPSPRH